MSNASTTFLHETPILMEALAEAANTTAADVADHLADPVHNGQTVAEFIEAYGPSA